MAERKDYINRIIRRKSRIITATTTITDTDDIVICNNGAANITINAPSTLLDDMCITVLRDANSTGTITLQGTGTTWQAAGGTFGATTTLGATATTRACTFVLKAGKWYRTTA